jgi:hypothetical protein
MLQLPVWPNRNARIILSGLLLLGTVPSATAQTSELPPSPQPSAAGLMSLDQLGNLVAPIALYPDQLLGQVLAASTYPLEVVEAQQWIQDNRSLQGAALLEAAKQQPWDPSIQALVAFPTVLAMLNRDIRWTRDLGNAFLSQQADVMDAIQRMRARAHDSGRLLSTPQQTVSVAAQVAQAPIEIQPANPQVVYVPTYNPAYVWGPPSVGAYPALNYPDAGSGFNFNPGVLLSALFTGLTSFGGWGWGLNWLTHGLFLSNLFFNHFGFGSLGDGLNGGFGGGVEESTAWVHDPSHRLGVAYRDPFVASRFAVGRSNSAFASPRSFSERSFSERSSGVRPNFPERTAGEWHSANQAYGQSSAGSRYNAPIQNFRRASNPVPQRAAPAVASPYRNTFAPARAPLSSARSLAPKPSSHSSAHTSAQHFSKSSRSSHFSAPHASSRSGGRSGGHSSGHSGGHSGKHK